METRLTADHQQFSNSLKVGNDNLGLRSNSQNEHEEDLENLLKGKYHPRKESTLYLSQSRNGKKYVSYIFSSICPVFACICLICAQYLSSIFSVRNLSIIAGILQGNYFQQWQVVGYLLTAATVMLLRLPWKPNKRFFSYSKVHFSKAPQDITYQQRLKVLIAKYLCQEQKSIAASCSGKF